MTESLNRYFKMKKIKKRIILIILLLFFGILHCYTERKFSNTPLKGVTKQLKEWSTQFGLD